MARPQAGGAFRYVGREFDPNAAGEKYPVSKTPYECDSDSPEGAYLAKCCREGDLIPADDATAKACGVPLPKAAPKSAKDGS